MKKIIALVLMLVGFTAFAVTPKNVVVSKTSSDGRYLVCVTDMNGYCLEIKDNKDPFYYVFLGSDQSCLRNFTEMCDDYDIKDFINYVRENETNFLSVLEDGAVTSIIFYEPSKAAKTEAGNPDIITDTSEYDAKFDSKIDQIVEKVFDKVMQALDKE